LGQWLSSNVQIPLPRGEPFEPGAGGSIIVIDVALFTASMFLTPLLRGRQTR
jgi:hypothetical protein